MKASNPDANDSLGDSVALSGDGTTLAVGGRWGRYEHSNATGIGGNQANYSLSGAGAACLAKPSRITDRRAMRALFSHRSVAVHERESSSGSSPTRSRATAPLGADFRERLAACSAARPPPLGQGRPRVQPSALVQPRHVGPNRR